MNDDVFKAPPSGPQIAAALASVLATGRLSRLKELVLDQLMLGGRDVAPLISSLPGQVEVLGLGYSELGVEGMSALAARLPLLCCLGTLDLQGTRLTEEALNSFNSALPPGTRLPSVEVLVLESAWLDDDCAPSLATVLCAFPRLQRLDLSHNSGLDDSGMESIASAIASLDQLQDLNLCFIGLSVAGAPHVLRAISALPSLRKLDLGMNIIGPDGIACVATAFPCLAQLTELRLSYAQLGFSGLSSLAAALPHLAPSLAVLDLVGNSIGDAGATSLAAVLPQLQQLRELYLAQNGIGDLGLADLARAAPLLTHLERLDLETTLHSLGSE